MKGQWLCEAGWLAKRQCEWMQSRLDDESVRRKRLREEKAEADCARVCIVQSSK